MISTEKIISWSPTILIGRPASS